jgi:hypothetical protein
MLLYLSNTPVLIMISGRIAAWEMGEPVVAREVQVGKEESI